MPPMNERALGARAKVVEAPLAKAPLVEAPLARAQTIRTRRAPTRGAASTILAFVLAACGGGSEDAVPADRIGVGATCTSTDECPTVVTPEDETVQLICLTQFTGGYCGLPDCETNEDCPGGSSCVRHDDGQAYCFRDCLNKAECNRNRPVDAEANCSSSFDFNDPADDAGQKACIPPSSGA